MFSLWGTEDKAVPCRGLGGLQLPGQHVTRAVAGGVVVCTCTTLHDPMQPVWVTVVWLPPLAAEPRSVCAARLTVEHTTRIQSTAVHRLQQVARSWAPCMCAGTLCVLVCCVLQTLCAVCSVACAVSVGSQLTHPYKGFDRRCCGTANLTCSTDSCSGGCGALTGWRVCALYAVRCVLYELVAACH